MADGGATKPPELVPTWLGHEWEEGETAVPLLAAVGNYVANTAAYKLQWGLLGVILAALTGILLAVAVTAGRRYANATRGYLYLLALAAAAWDIWAQLDPHGPLNLHTTVPAAAVGALVAGALWKPVRLHQRRWEIEQHHLFGRLTEPAKVADSSDATRVAELFKSIGMPGMELVKNVDTPAGFTWRLRLPVGGKLNMEQIAEVSWKVEQAAGRLLDGGLRDGAVRVERARNDADDELAGEILVHFDVRDVLAARLDMPDEHERLSIRNAFKIGKFADGTDVCLTLRQIRILIVGLTGNGKSNLLSAIIYRVSACSDAVIWLADPKKRLARMWLQGWLDDAAWQPCPDPCRAPAGVPCAHRRRPVFDWVAVTRRQIWRMLQAYEAGVDDRTCSGGPDAKVEPTPEKPAVIFICDELPEIASEDVGPRLRGDADDDNPTSAMMMEKAFRCVRLGRSEACDTIFATQSGRVDLSGGGNLKEQCKCRIYVGFGRVDDTSGVIDGIANKRMIAKLRHPGTVLIDWPIAGIRQMAAKIFFLGDDASGPEHLIYRAAVTRAANQLTGRLDKRFAAAAAPYGYGERWSAKELEWMAARDDDDGPPAPAAPAPSPQPRPGGGMFTFSNIDARRDQPATAEPVTDDTPEPAPAKVGPTREQTDTQEWADVFAAIAAEYDTAEVPEPDPPATAELRYQRMVRIVQRQPNPDGLVFSQIWNLMGDLCWGDKSSMHDALKKAIRNDDIRREGPADHTGRYFPPRGQ